MAILACVAISMKSTLRSIRGHISMVFSKKSR